MTLIYTTQLIFTWSGAFGVGAFFYRFSSKSVTYRSHYSPFFCILMIVSQSLVCSFRMYKFLDVPFNHAGFYTLTMLLFAFCNYFILFSLLLCDAQRGCLLADSVRHLQTFFQLDELEEGTLRNTRVFFACHLFCRHAMSFSYLVVQLVRYWSVFGSLADLCELVVFMLIEAWQIQFILLVFFIDLLFAKLHHSVSNFSAFKISASKLQASRVLLKALKECCAAHVALDKMAEDVNEVHAVSITLGLFLGFTTIVYFSYLMFLHPELPEMINYCLFLSIYLWKLISVAWACTSVTRKSRQTVQNLHDQFIDNEDPELSEQLELMSLHYLHRELKFNACGLIQLDYTLVFAMVGALSAFIIVMIQFHPPT